MDDLCSSLTFCLCFRLLSPSPRLPPLSSWCLSLCSQDTSIFHLCHLGAPLGAVKTPQSSTSVILVPLLLQSRHLNLPPLSYWCPSWCSQDTSIFHLCHLGAPLGAVKTPQSSTSVILVPLLVQSRHLNLPPLSSWCPSWCSQDTSIFDLCHLGAPLGAVKTPQSSTSVILVPLLVQSSLLNLPPLSSWCPSWCSQDTSIFHLCHLGAPLGAVKTPQSSTSVILVPLLMQSRHLNLPPLSSWCPSWCSQDTSIFHLCHLGAPLGAVKTPQSSTSVILVPLLVQSRHLSLPPLSSWCPSWCSQVSSIFHLCHLGAPLGAVKTPQSSTSVILVPLLVQSRHLNLPPLSSWCPSWCSQDTSILNFLSSSSSSSDAQIPSLVDDLQPSATIMSGLMIKPVLVIAERINIHDNTVCPRYNAPRYNADSGITRSTVAPEN